MKLHGRAELSLNARRRLASRVVERGWTLGEAAAAPKDGGDRADRCAGEDGLGWVVRSGERDGVGQNGTQDGARRGAQRASAFRGLHGAAVAHQIQSRRRKERYRPPDMMMIRAVETQKPQCAENPGYGTFWP